VPVTLRTKLLTLWSCGDIKCGKKFCSKFKLPEMD